MERTASHQASGLHGWVVRVNVTEMDFPFIVRRSLRKAAIVFLVEINGDSIGGQLERDASALQPAPQDGDAHQLFPICWLGCELRQPL